MKKNAKKIFIVLLVLSVISPLFSTHFYAADAYQVNWLSKEYDRVEQFRNGYASVMHIIDDKGSMIRGLHGVIDKDGKLVVPLKYDGGVFVGGIKDGVVKISDETTDGKRYAQIEYKHGYFDIRTGKEILPPTYDILGGFYDGLAWVRKDESFSGPVRFGYIDRTGNFIVPLVYDSAKNFIDGFAVAKKDGVWHLIDKLGQVVKTLPYDNIGSFCEGIAVVKKDDKFGYIDTMGNEIVPPMYDSLSEKYSEASDFQNGFAVVQLNGKRNIIDKTGKQLFSESYDYIKYYGEGLFIVGIPHTYSSYDKDYKYGMIDKNGKKLTECVYSSISETGFKDGLAIVSKGGASWRFTNTGSKKGFIDKTGKEVIPAVYDAVFDFNDGMARVKKGGKWFFTDKKGKTFSYSYDTIGDFHNGLAVVSKSEKMGVINKAGKIVVPLIYDSLGEFQNGLSRVTKFQKKINYGTRVEYVYKTGYINQTGKIVVPLIYDSLFDFSEGFAVAKRNEKWGFVNSAGKEVIPCIYKEVTNFDGGVSAVKLNDRWGIIKNPLKP